MAEVLVLLDSQDQKVRSATAELLTLANQLGQPVALWAAADEPSAQLQQELQNWGATRVDWLRGPSGEDLSAYLARPLAHGVAQVMAEASPRAVLATSNFANKEFAAHLAFLTDSGVLTDLAGVEAGDELIGHQTIFAGTWNSSSTITSGTPILLVKPGAIDIPAPAGAAAASAQTASDAGASAQAGPAGGFAMREVSVANALEGRSARIVERTALPEASGPDLVSATRVVVGGRGTEGEFGPVRELAQELGAAVGATRVATDEGWIDPATQVGQTGVTITPRLYIGAGVSGAVHHLSGMQASEVIVAINSDSDAPLLEMADFGVVGDMHQILPQAVQELRRLREQSS